ncbi:FAD-dependent oxidoreductase [Candidatus Woesearchaeota archaeon]|nr:FAD-dependent oxidoreductase [Candidatus Woesearchaeota archaeon]
MNPPKHLTATITKIEAVSEEVKRFVLDLSEPITFVPGQFVNLRFPGDTRYHAFSIASSPKIQDSIELVIKKEHEFTTKLFEQSEGVELECMGPMGNFMHDLDGDIVMIAGGVGITPFLGVLRWARDFEKKDQHFWLFLSNRTRDRIIGEEELRELDKMENLHVVFSVTREQPEGWDGELGHFDKDVLLKHLNSFDDKTFFTCGPGRMVEGICSMLVDAGVPEEKVKRESWG